MCCTCEYDVMAYVLASHLVCRFATVFMCAMWQDVQDRGQLAHSRAATPRCVRTAPVVTGPFNLHTHELRHLGAFVGLLLEPVPF